uniref:Uncharacterized protein n=1 Tax=Rhizophora mucronata TaxID=61149 RepID=A0A2P2PU64_RHIMU
MLLSLSLLVSKPHGVQAPGKLWFLNVLVCSFVRLTTWSQGR